MDKVPSYSTGECQQDSYWTKSHPIQQGSVSKIRTGHSRIPYHRNESDQTSMREGRNDEGKDSMVTVHSIKL